MGLLREVKTREGWQTWAPDTLRGKRILAAKLANGFFVEFGSNPDIAIYDQEMPDRSIVCAIEVKGGTDESNAYYRMADAAETLQRSRHMNPRCFTVMVSESIIAPVLDLLKREPCRSLVDRYYGVSQLLSNEEAQHRLVGDLRQVLGLS